MRDPVSPGVKLAVTLKQLHHLYHNYKGFHSIVLFVLVDGDYKFLWVEVGAARSSSDAQIFKHSDLRHKIDDSSINFPESESLELVKVKVGVLRPVQQPGSYWDRSSELPLVGLEPTEVTAYD